MGVGQAVGLNFALVEEADMQTTNASFWFKASEHGNVVVASGEIDVTTAPQLGESIAQFCEGDVVVDITNVDFVDSSGLHVFVAAHRLLARRGSRLIVRGASGMTMCLMEITGLDEVLSFDGENPTNR
jgi:anti-sigma B factor antagonist